MTRKGDLIEKLYRGQCSEQELLELMSLLKNQEDDLEQDTMMRLWEELGQNQMHKNTPVPARVYQEIISDLEASHKQYPPAQNTPRRRSYRLVQLSATAIIIFAIGASVWLWNNTYNSASEVIIATSSEMQIIELPDHSIVELAPNSVLTYAKQWIEGNERHVKLNGAAFFKVHKYPTKNVKFQVITTDLTAEVLGTSFNVKTSDNQTEVILKEGLVRLDLNEKTKDIIMEVGDVITYSLQTRERSKRHITKDNSTMWRADIVTMKNVELSEILQNIEEIYSIKILAKNESTLDRVFTIGVPNNNFETTLSVLKEVMKLNVIEEEDHYVIM